MESHLLEHLVLQSTTSFMWELSNHKLSGLEHLARLNLAKTITEDLSALLIQLNRKINMTQVSSMMLSK